MGFFPDVTFPPGMTFEFQQKRGEALFQQLTSGQDDEKGFNGREGVDEDEYTE